MATSGSAPAPTIGAHFTPSTSFRFPPEYSFPPFFTIQPNLTTRHAQFAKWSALIQSYCQHRRIYRLSPANPSASGAPDLFHNTRIDRRLDTSGVREVLEAMRKDPGGGGVRAEPVDTVPGGGGGAAGGDDSEYWVYWRTPGEWAALLEGWIAETAQQGSVLTLYEITEGEATRSTEFHSMDQELLLKALNVLVKKGKAQIFGQGESQGVKFF